MSNSILKKYGLSLEDAEAILDRAPVTALVYVFDHDSFYEESKAEFGCVLIEDLVSEVDELKKERQGLISGADAKLAWAKGENVQVRPKTPSETWENLSGKHSIDIFEQVISYEFRRKPHTIKLELEIPAPFEPKKGDTAYFLSTINACGYTCTNDFKGYGFDSLIQFGAWRTEEEIKQVVAALRGGIKA